MGEIMNEKVKRVIRETCCWIIFLVIVFFFITYVSFDNLKEGSSFKDAWYDSIAFFSALSTLGAAIVAAYLVNIWREQESTIFKRNLAYSSFQEMLMLITIFEHPKHKEYDVIDLQKSFNKIIGNIMILKNHNKKNIDDYNQLIKDLSKIYIKNLGLYESIKRENNQDNDNFKQLINDLHPILYKFAELTNIDTNNNIDIFFK